MRKVSVSLLCLLFLITSLSLDASAQTRRRSRFGRKARTAAMIAGGAAVGGLIGGKKGAAIGAGGAGTYAFNRKAARRHFSSRTRTIGATASGASLGSGVGAVAGGRRGAAAGAIVGGTGGYLYRRHKRRLPRRY
ncbi:MAG: glycine zipper domain-containing protein [Pyrinomonadaceae bacterium]